MKSEMFYSDRRNELLDLIQSLVECTDSASLGKCMSQLHFLLDYQSLLLGVVKTGGEGGRQTINKGFSDKWLSTYLAENLWKFEHGDQPDNLIQPPVFWEEHCRQQPDRYRKLAKMMAAESLEEGCTVQCISQAENEVLFLSVAGPENHRWAWTAFVLKRVLPHICLAMARLRKGNVASKLRQLTKRESEILDWLKLGKTSWEMSVILNVTESTINFHVQNIKSKLDVVNRSQAVAMALQGVAARN